VKLSVLIPVYNERTLVERSLSAVLAAPLPESMERELVVVDDCSTDGTTQILERFASAHPEVRLFRHEVNQGKGAAVRTAIAHAEGDFCLIQDADLEYDPNDYPALLRPLLDGDADAVFGSRYVSGSRRRVLPFWHSNINRILTFFCNMFSNLDLTDMETCYKAFRTDLLKSIPIRSNRFGIEPEITMKCAKRKLRIYEVPISYHGRTYEEGKKIGWQDGVKALAAILYYWLIDDLYVQPYGRAYLNNLTGTPQYISWIVRLIRPYLGDQVLELGAGIGNFTGRLMSRRLHYVAAERDPLYLHALHNRFFRTPSVSVRSMDPERAEDYTALRESFDTVVCLNVIEYAENPEIVLRGANSVLAPGGSLVLLVPQGEALYGSLDRTLGHRRRFQATQLTRLLEMCGFAVERSLQLNKISTLAWWVNSRVLSSRHISKPTLKIFDKTVWLWRRLDPLIPWRGLSLVIIARKRAAAAGEVQREPMQNKLSSVLK
jgi:glycosyltransferase involved in cell wall biosynthesis